MIQVEEMIRSALFAAFAVSILAYLSNSAGTYVQGIKHPFLSGLSISLGDSLRTVLSTTLGLHIPDILSPILQIQPLPWHFTCVAIEDSTSSVVSYPGSAEYEAAVSHWAPSSSEVAACSAEPATSHDLGKILRIIGATRTPFAVKSGGHTSNPGFSSTTGIQISMSKFSNVAYNSQAGTVDIGTGLVWREVYAALRPHNVNVVGGRVGGVGVGGFALGGGFSFLTNQHGLSVDTIHAFELVLPNGTVTNVTEHSQPDLFFALKGTWNNFGIVTKITMTAFPQGLVWGGQLVFGADQISEVTAATSKFSTQVKDPKAAMYVEYSYFGSVNVAVNIFYDHPAPPMGIFDDFLKIPYIKKDISSGPFSSFPGMGASNVTIERGTVSVISVTEFSKELLEAIVNETSFWATTTHGLKGVIGVAEPFLDSIFTHGKASAYPPDRSRALLPVVLYWTWSQERLDTTMRTLIRRSASHLTRTAMRLGQDVANAAVCGNFAQSDTPLELLYGKNLERLKAIKKQYDPQGIMGLTGGFLL